MTNSEREAGRMPPLAGAGADEVLIARVIHRFYQRVRADALLGPVFAARIDVWEPHLARMCDFWSSLLLMNGRYRGQPMQAHRDLNVDARHFDRWLALFEETAREVAPEAVAAQFTGRARRIARSLELGVAARRGIVLAKEQRLARI